MEPQEPTRLAKTNTNFLTGAVWWSTLVLFCLAGILLIWYSIAQFQSVKQAVDFLARDGSLEFFTLDKYQHTQSFANTAGIIFLLSSVLWIIFQTKTRRFIDLVLDALRNYSLLADIREIISTLRIHQDEYNFAVILILSTIGAFIIRWFYLFRPMRYDEAYTVVAFAIRPLWNAIADYHLPNNHVFHTLFVHFSTQWFGIEEWSARLPALFAGVLCVPTGYFLGKSLYNRSTGLLAAVWIGFSPILIDFSTNARGYTILCLLTLVLLGIANIVRSSKNYAAWGLLSLVSALGFFTLPTMLYPFGATYLWLALSWLIRDISDRYKKIQFPLLLTLSGLLSGLLTLIFYTPVLLTSGINALFANRHVVSLSWFEFSGNLVSKWLNTWQFWTNNWPIWLSLCFGVGILLSLVLHKRIGRYRIHLLFPTFLGIAIALIIQRVTPLPRIWLYLLPLMIMLSSAGWVGVVKIFLQKTSKKTTQLAQFILILGLGLVLVLATVQNDKSYSVDIAGPVGEAQFIANQLNAKIDKSEVIAANSPIQAPLRFYLLKLGYPPEISYDENAPFTHKHVVLVVEKDANMADELRRLKLDELALTDNPELIAETDNLIAFRLYTNP